MKGCILPSSKKGDFGLAKNYRGIKLTSIAAKIYNALLRNRIEPKIDNILRKKQNGFRRNRSTTSQILTIRRILEDVWPKKPESDITICGLYQGLRFHFYRNTKVKVRSPDGDTEYFNIVAGVLPGDTLAPYFLIICLGYVLRTSIDKIRENGF